MRCGGVGIIFGWSFLLRLYTNLLWILRAIRAALNVCAAVSFFALGHLRKRSSEVCAV